MPIGCSASRAGRHSKRPRIRRITPEQFREIREFTGKSREDVAEFLGVSLRTVGHWETGKARVPYAAFRLLRLALRGDMLDPAWQGYRIVRGRLVTPEGYAFGPGDLAWLSLLVQRANFASLAAVGAVTLRSGGHCAVDRQAGRAASSGAGESDSSPASADFSVGLPATNRGVSETERLAPGVGKPKRRAIPSRHQRAGRPAAYGAPATEPAGRPERSRRAKQASPRRIQTLGGGL